MIEIQMSVEIGKWPKADTLRDERKLPGEVDYAAPYVEDALHDMATGLLAKVVALHGDVRDHDDADAKMHGLPDRFRERRITGATDPGPQPPDVSTLDGPAGRVLSAAEDMRMYWITATPDAREAFGSNFPKLAGLLDALVNAAGTTP